MELTIHRFTFAIHRTGLFIAIEQLFSLYASLLVPCKGQRWGISWYEQGRGIQVELGLLKVEAGIE